MGNNMSKPVILTGIRSNERSNSLVIISARCCRLLTWLKGAGDEFEVNLFVPDLHSFHNTHQTMAKLYDKKRLIT
jgi:hypothetical protein